MKNILLLFMFCAIIAQSQPPKKFYTRFGGNGYDVGYDVKQTLDNGYIITGSTSSYGQGNTDLYLVKLDSMGNKVFEHTFGSYNNEIGKSVIQLIDSSYVMVGYTNSIGFGGYDIFLVKADKNGILLWQKTIGGIDWDFAYSLQQTNDGGFIIGGTTYSYGRGNADGYVVKTDASGNVSWTKTFGGANDDEFKSVIQTADLGYALTGYTKSYNDVDSGDVWVFKLNNLGDSTWCKFYGGSKEDFGNEIIEHPSGEFYVVGSTASFGVGLLDGYCLRIDNNGTEILHQQHGTSGGDESFVSVVVSKRSSSIIGLIEKENFIAYDLQIRLIEFTAIGLSYSNATGYGSINNDECFKLISTKDKGYACVGYTMGFDAINTDIYFLKSDSMLIGSSSIVSLKENIIFQKNKINIYPNPSISEINIISPTAIKTIFLYDIYGNEIMIKENLSYLNINHILMNVQNLKNGIYFISIDSNVEKFSILH